MKQVMKNYYAWATTVEQNWSASDFDAATTVPYLWYKKQNNKTKIWYPRTNSVTYVNMCMYSNHLHKYRIKIIKFYTRKFSKYLLNFQHNLKLGCQWNLHPTDVRLTRLTLRHLGVMLLICRLDLLRCLDKILNKRTQIKYLVRNIEFVKTDSVLGRV